MADQESEKTIAESSTATAKSLPKIPEIELERQIGAGGMGEVYVGRQAYIDRRVAVKVLTVYEESGPGYDERFRREAKLLAALSHPHIVGCFQAGVSPAGLCYLAMEYIDGPNLTQHVRAHGALDPVDALAVTVHVAEALAYAHERGIIHRDVKPDNVLLQRNSRAPEGDPFPFVPKLADLGLARPLETGGDMPELTAAGAILGTPSTMAPEQISDPDSVDFRADVYGLGCVLFFAATGRRAFPQAKAGEIMMRKAQGEIPDPREVNPALHAEVVRHIQWMMQTMRARRPQSYRELTDSLRATIAQLGGIERMEQMAGSGGGSIARTPTIAAKGLARPRSRRRAPMFGLVAVIVGAGVTGVMWRGREKRDTLPAAATAAARTAAPTPEPTPAATPQPTPAPSPSPSPSPTPSPTPAPAPVEFEAVGESLLSEGFVERTEGWTAFDQEGGGFFPPDDEGGKLQGTGRCRLVRTLPEGGPWRVLVRFGSVQEAAGVRVELADGRAIALRLQHIADLFGSIMPYAKPDADSVLGKRGTTIQPAKETMKAPVDVEVTIESGVVRFRVRDMVFDEVALDGTPVGISLFNEGGLSSIEDVLLFQPKK